MNEGRELEELSSTLNSSYRIREPRTNVVNCEVVIREDEFQQCFRKFEC